MITLKQGDCLELMKELEDESIDSVITDPPYFRIMKQEWNGKKHEWDNQWENRSAYLTWISDVMKEVKRIIKNNGSFYMFADDKMSCYIRLEAEKIGFQLINEIIWVKQNNMTIKGWNIYRQYAPITERILFFGFPESDYELASDGLVSTVFNPLKQYLIEEKKKTGLTGDEINKLVGTASMAGRHYFSDSQWCFPIKEHYERMQLTFNAFYRKLGNVEEIAGLTNQELFTKLSGYDVLRKDYEELRKDYEELRRYFNPSNNFMDVWISNLTATTDEQTHPTQKPVWMIRRIIETSCKPEGIVLDPFMGSGTTGVACKQLGRNFIGYELDPEYFKIAEMRIEETNESTISIEERESMEVDE